MSDAEKTPLAGATPPDAPSDEGRPKSGGDVRQLERRLRGLRRHLRMQLLIRGMSLLAVAVLGLALFSLVVDRTFRLSEPARVALGVVYLGCIGWLLWHFLLRSWTVRLRDEVLADLLERRYPELQDRLRSSLDFLRDPAVGRGGAAAEKAAGDRGQRLALQMKRRVVAQTLDEVERLDFGAVVNTPAVVAPMSCAFFAIAVVLALAGPLGGTMVTWYQRNVLLEDSEWPYRTRLAVEGFDAPEYSRGIPRGDPLLVRVHVIGETPDRVRITVDYGGESRRHSLARESEFRFVFEEPRVSQDFTFEVAGGDFRSKPHTVRVLERPEVEALSLRLEYPPYTEKPARTIEGDIGELPVPEGSMVRLKGSSTKPLRGAALALESRRVSLVVSPGDQREFRGAFEPKAGGTATVHLEDLEGVPPDRLFSFFVQLVPDRLPTVRASAYGVSSMVTPDARIPLRVLAEDDYRVTALGVAYKTIGRPVEGEAGEGEAGVDRSREDEAKPDTEADDAAAVWPGAHRFPALEGALQRIEKEETWDIQPLRFDPDTRLDVRVTAFDNDGLHGPKEGQSSTMSFLVVTVDRLGEELLRREVEQRRALERALELERGVRDGIYRAVDGAWNQEGALQDEPLKELVALAKTQRQLALQVGSIGQTVGHILDEMRNNRIAEAADTARLADGIISPIETLATRTIRDTVRLVGRVREEENRLLRVSHGWELAQGVEQVIEELERVLTFMRRMEGFTEIVHRLRNIIKTHREATTETRRLYEQAVDQIFEDGDLFEEEGEDDGADESDDREEEPR